MNDPKILLELTYCGAAIALVAASLYFATSRRERSGFYLFPDSPREWTHYWFRSLTLAAVAGMLISPSTAVGSSLLAFSALLLFGSSFAFWQSDRGFCIAGFTMSVVAFVWVLLLPHFATARSV